MPPFIQYTYFMAIRKRRFLAWIFFSFCPVVGSAVEVTALHANMEKKFKMKYFKCHVQKIGPRGVELLSTSIREIYFWGLSSIRGIYGKWNFDLCFKLWQAVGITGEKIFLIIVLVDCMSRTVGKWFSYMSRRHVYSTMIGQ